MEGRTIAIMQPTYLPWLGYFDLIDQSDCFVFLDSVQFSKRSWQQRNRLKGITGPVWCSVSVHSKGQREQPISAVEIDHGQGSLAKHVKIIRHSYEKAAFFSHVPEISRILQSEPRFLADLNVELILAMCGHLEVEAEFIRSSSLSAPGAKSELLVNICTELGATRYLSAIGSKGYIEEKNPFPEKGIDLVYHDYEHPRYTQLHGSFESHLSALDLLLNEGPASGKVVESGRRSTSHG